ncbi:Hypothetical predicted protein [Paramuricea clavata]|uniref:Uncharacterized protein n=1 Tax=Paramuricea clavata TaxID=317549 RepID=A0A6S7HPU9_PARCT|nr:Hypothetical predicted protein [Paramuricea clavata]
MRSNWTTDLDIETLESQRSWATLSEVQSVILIPIHKERYQSVLEMYMENTDSVKPWNKCKKNEGMVDQKIFKTAKRYGFDSVYFVEATPPDGIPAYLLKRSAEVIAPSLTVLFELSLLQGAFPSQWKYVNVVPIPKKGDAHEVTNYRPVSLLSRVSKILERCIFGQVSSFIKDSLYDIQHGFRCNRSCVTQLLNVFHDLGRALDSGNEIDLLYLDFAKAFDSVFHSKLLFKLNYFGISGQLLNWLAD